MNKNEKNIFYLEFEFSAYAYFKHNLIQKKDNRSKCKSNLTKV